MNYMETKYGDTLAAKLAELQDKPAFKPYQDYSNGDDAFALYLAFVDRRITKMIGIGLFDLEDCLIRDMYDDEYTPQEAAVAAIQNDDLYSELLGYELTTGEYY